MFKQSVEALSEILGSDVPGHAPRNGDLFSSSILGATKRHETFRLKPADGLSLPSVILPSSGDIEDFFATVATYYQDQSPLSALVHVLSEETSSLFVRQPEVAPPRIANQSRSCRMAHIGAAMGEAMLAGLGAHDVGGALSYSACRRTLAFALCRATLLYDSVLRADFLAERWARLRKLTGLSASAAATEVVLLAHWFAFASDSMSKEPHVEDALSDALQLLARGDDCDGELLVRVLADLYPDTRRHLDDLRGAFDGRMTAFTRLVEAIQSGSRGVRTDEIAVAFVCNRILPGSFAHAGVLATLVDFFPAALIWYGFFSVLSGSVATQQVSSGLIAKLERDLLDAFSFEQRPRCDISLEELEVLSRTQLRAEMVKPSQQRALLVALLPGVDIYTRFGTEGDAVGERLRREAETEELHRRVSRLLEEALHALEKPGLVNRVSTSAPVNRRPRKGR